MTNEKRAFSSEQFQEYAMENPELELYTYEFQNDEGVFSGVLIAKKWGKSRNLIAYVELDNGRKIMCSAYWSKEYFGFPDIPVGERVRLTFKKSRTGKINLTDVEVIE